MKKISSRRAILGVLATAAILGIGGLYIGGAFSQGAASIAALAKDTHFHGIAVDPADSSRVYLATHHGLYVMGHDGRAQRRLEGIGAHAVLVRHSRDDGKLLALRVV